MEEHPARRRARELQSAAEQFRSALTEPGRRPGDGDFAAMLPTFEYILNTLCEAVGETSDVNTDLKTTEILEDALERLSGIFLLDAQEGLDAAAYTERIAQAAEAAWREGSLDGERGVAPAITSDSQRYHWTGMRGHALAIVLELPAPSASAGPGGTPVARAAAESYCAAYAEASGTVGARPSLCGYLPGYRVTTVLGKEGILTGEAGPGGRPRIRLGDGGTVTVPREAIREPLPHTLSSLTLSASRDLAGNPSVIDGDILLSPTRRHAWVKARDTWMHVHEFDPAADGQQHIRSFLRALMIVRASGPQSSAERATSPAVPGSPQAEAPGPVVPRVRSRPRRFPSARGTARGAAPGARRHQGL